MVFAALRHFLARYAQTSRSRRPSRKPKPSRHNHSGRRWAFEQLEARLVPSTLTANKLGYALAGQTTNLSVLENDGSAWVTTDKSDYHPGTIATMTAGGFKPGETVDFQVVNVTRGHVYAPL